MITPLDYRTISPGHIITLAFYAHSGIAMDRAQATFSEDCPISEDYHCNSNSIYSSPTTSWRSGCDYRYADGNYGTFDIPFAIRIDRPNRRFSP